MANSWRNMQYFRNCCSAPDDFQKMCLAFTENQTEREELAVAYRRASRELNLRSTNSSDRLVSASTRQERMIVEFCLAMLVELQGEGSNGIHAVGTLLKELHNIDWDDDCYKSDFYLSIPKVGQERLVFQMSLVEACRWTLNRYCYAVVCAYSVFSDLYREWTIVRWICGLGVAILLLLLGITIAMIFLQVMVGSIADTAAGLTASTTSWFLQTFASSKPPSNVDFPSTPIHEGVFKAAGGAIYLSEVAANLSIVPQLLQQSKSSVLNAADIIAGSTLEDKDRLAAEYTKLFGDIDELTEVSQDWNSGVDILVADFETLLSMALSQVGAIRTPVDFQDSIYAVVSQLCITMCLDNTMPVYFHERECKLCGTWAAATMAGVLCLDTSTIIPDLVCSPLLKLMPGIELYMDEVADSRVNAVHRLRQFLEALDGQMHELIRGAEQGKELCTRTKARFRKIRSINYANDNTIRNHQLDVIEAKRWQPNYLLDWVGFSYGLIEARVGLRRDHINLNRTIILNDVALHMFTQVEDVLSAWKRDIKGVLRSLQNFEHLADKGWRGAWQDMQNWEDLRVDFEKLRPVVTALARAQTRMTAKIKDRETSFNEAMEACFAAAKRPGRKVAFDWGACYDERKLLL